MQKQTGTEPISRINDKVSFLAAGLVIVIYVLLIGALVALTIRMASVPDARFAFVYTCGRFLILSFLVIMGLFGNNRTYLVLTAAILVLSLGCHRLLFGASIEEYLYRQNKAMYQEAAQEMVAETADWFPADYFGVSDYLRGPKKRLFNVETLVARGKTHTEVFFGIRTSIARPANIVYTTGMKAFLKERSKRDKITMLDKNWCVVHYSD